MPIVFPRSIKRTLYGQQKKAPVIASHQGSKGKDVFMNAQHHTPRLGACQRRSPYEEPPHDGYA